MKHPPLALFACAPIVFLALRCGQPVDESGRNLLTLERVWQYCEAFSIYQNNVPSEAEALAFNEPQQILDQLHDTLYSRVMGTGKYALYSDSCRLSQQASLLNQSTPGSDRTVYYKKLTDSTAYLQIAAFDVSTPIELKAIPTSRIASIPHLVIDITADGGGTIDAVMECLDILLPENVAYLIRAYRRNIIDDGGEMATITDTLITKPTVDSLKSWDGKEIAILIDGGSASAAEILAVGLVDGLGSNALLMGQPSFGKAIGQYIFCFFSAEGSVEMTGFRFHRLAGRPDYHEKGIDPAITLTEGPGKARRWIIAAGQQLETNFLAHLLSPTVIDSVVRERQTLGKVHNGTDQASAGLRGPSRSGCYKLITAAPFPLFSNQANASR
jgi:hypothetical protein